MGYGGYKSGGWKSKTPPPSSGGSWPGRASGGGIPSGVGGVGGAIGTGAAGTAGGGSYGAVGAGGTFGSSQHPSGPTPPSTSGIGGGSGIDIRAPFSYNPSGGAGLAPPPAAPGAGAPAAPPPYQPPASQPQMPYKPGAPAASGTAGQMQDYGAQMMDPNSELMRRMQEMLTGRIGEETGAAKRLAAFQASQAGMGGGGSPELSAMLGDIDIGGLEAGGRASADLMTQMPGMAHPFLASAMQGQLGASGQDLQAWLAQQQLNQRGQEMNIGSYYQGQRLDLDRQRMEQDAMMSQLAGMFA